MHTTQHQRTFSLVFYFRFLCALDVHVSSSPLGLDVAAVLQPARLRMPHGISSVYRQEIYVDEAFAR